MRVRYAVKRHIGRIRFFESSNEINSSHGGEHSFSEMAYSGLVNKKGSEKEYIQTAKLIKEGLSCEQIADVKIRDVRTIEAWVAAISQKSQNFRAFYLCVDWHHN